MGEPISPSPEDLQGLPEEALTGLIAKGRAQGSLTDADVFFALPDVEPSPAQLEAIYTYIRASGIPVEEISADLPSLDELERRYVARVLAFTKGNISKAAKILGIDRKTLYRMRSVLSQSGTTEEKWDIH